jgi:hypothetical protein
VRVERRSLFKLVLGRAIAVLKVMIRGDRCFRFGNERAIAVLNVG